MGEWSGWESGDSVGMPNWPHGPTLDQHEILRRVAAAYRRVVIDWTEGDRWVDARIAAWEKQEGPPVILAAERALRGRTVLVSVADAAGPGAAGVRFYMTPDTASLDLHYEPPGAEPACRELGRKLAEVLGYEFATDDGPEPAEPSAAADRGGSS
ncbi:hypothetical protein R5W24_005094 [Gemmata sp. JC717]|uniref:hypothetical protein n=1 Tax=Gemmata algarum TaxID=2975278 RepID=UPI0021BA3CDE|nr:hypothetical protein [Gemmata algarum]MDY3555948.1 hypothetical protein [Gemmata algarum]